MTEMTKMADILSTVSYVCFALAGLCFVLAVFFWFKHKIPSVIGDLSGKTARKSIESMRASNEKSGDKSFKPSYINAQRGKLTGTMTNLNETTGSIAKPEEKPIIKKAEISPETELMKENMAVPSMDQATEPLSAEETALLTEETALLSEETALLSQYTDEESYIETDLLEDNKAVFDETEEIYETSLLVDDEVTGELTETEQIKPTGKKLVMLDDIMEIHTDITVL